jgi:hypothetical protein
MTVRFAPWDLTTIRCAFGTASVVTTLGKGYLTDRIKATPSIIPTCSPKWCAMGKGATGAARTAVVGDTALTCEAVSVEGRVAGAETSQTTTSANDTYQNVATLTASSASSSGAQAIDEAALFLASSSGGPGMFVSHTFPVINIFGPTSDTIAFTQKVQLT